MNFRQLEKYASNITVYSDLSPQGRPERGFVQPLELHSEADIGLRSPAAEAGNICSSPGPGPSVLRKRA